VDHRGVVFNELIGALAHLGLARACTLEGDNAKEHTAYQDFFPFWKNADPNLVVDASKDRLREAPMNPPPSPNIKFEIRHVLFVASLAAKE
jgi:hypothetical protein